MELSIAAHGDQGVLVPEPRKKEKQDFKKVNKFSSKSDNKESKAIATALVKITTKVSKKLIEKIDISPEMNKNKLSLKDMQSK